jgi:hypothetical protein
MEKIGRHVVPEVLFALASMKSFLQNNLRRSLSGGRRDAYS